MTKWREEIIGDCRLILGDCREALPTLGVVDLVLTDPPYGIGAQKGIGRSDRIRQSAQKSKDSDWDSQPPDSETISKIVGIGKKAILWGGNYFGLPASRCFLIWDKKTQGEILRIAKWHGQTSILWQEFL